MKKETLVEAAEKLAAELIEQAKQALTEGMETEIPVYSEIFRERPDFPHRYRGQTHISPEVGEIVDRMLKLSKKNAQVHKTGLNDPHQLAFHHFVEASSSIPHLYSLYETAELNGAVLGHRSSIIVGIEHDPRDFQGFSYFFEHIIGPSPST